ncbi:hypothetical protein H8356DRAFT_1053777 [Neocallimastix lanati (nom. inval.)]|uniref:Uncharacterized protein n=1 Tax=Neocallimastix californiae TaxID=1754190 RepID=A0A1Y2BVC2_9FUNG|nr:hypothetical protein H8356DRAFT_1053777 [Neocallimastix sp. JGI-2020a]ORY38045.1 hypothetical protein LY90DRAFT_511052 [Neocallimastix californiae]|eukprot:ORY38045.1 hypothetical protein LY90DRAFT_511052 [Neocallimastix californiae]
MNNSLNIEKDNFSISFRKEFEEIINYLSEIENFEITKFLNNLMIEIASTTTPKGFNDLGKKPHWIYTLKEKETNKEKGFYGLINIHFIETSKYDDKNYKEPPQTILSRKEINFIQNIIDDSNCSVETLANNLKNDKIILEDFCDKLNIKRQK